MATDIILDDEGKERITFAATSLKTTAADILVDSPVRHKGKPGLRRALVHDTGDGLTLNFNDDYPGGLTLNDAQVRLQFHIQLGSAPSLPRRAVAGELYAVVCISPLTTIGKDLSVFLDGTSEKGRDEPKSKRDLRLTTIEGIAIEAAPKSDDVTLWLCVRGGPRRTAYWREIPLGSFVKGTL